MLKPKFDRLEAKACAACAGCFACGEGNWAVGVVVAAVALIF